MIRRALTAVVLAIYLLFCRSIANATTIQHYRLYLRPSSSRSGAVDVRLDLEYRSPTAENKRDGFKFVGSNQPRELRAHTRDGQPLTVQAQREESSGQWKIEFALSRGYPVSDYEEVSHAVIEFTQDLDERARWSSRQTELVWPSQFRVAVMDTQYTVAGGFEASGEGCVAQGDEFVCRPTTPAKLTLTRAGPSLSSLLAGFAFGIAAMFAILFIALRGRYLKLLEERGVLPPAPAPTYPLATSVDPKVFRAPPPLPTPEQLPNPTLPDNEKQRWSRNLGITVAVAFAPLVVTVLYITVFGAVFSPALALCLAMVLGALMALIVNSDGDPRVWPSVVASFCCVGPLTAGISGLIVAVVGSFVGFGIIQAIKNAPAGGSGGSSSCSSSSCGGGGGGCGGGGGGGGCGG